MYINFMPFFRNDEYINNEKTFLKLIKVIFRLFKNLLRTPQKIRKESKYYAHYFYECLFVIHIYMYMNNNNNNIIIVI